MHDYPIWLFTAIGFLLVENVIGKGPISALNDY